MSVEPPKFSTSRDRRAGDHDNNDDDDDDDNCRRNGTSKVSG